MDENNPERQRSALRRALEDLAKGAGIQRPDLLVVLGSQLRRRWGISDDMAPSATRSIIRAQLFSCTAKLTPPRAKPSGQYRHAVRVSFNIYSDIEHEILKDTDLTGRREWLAKQAPADARVSVSTAQRYLKDAINQIEQQILSADYKPVNIVADAEQKFDPLADLLQEPPPTVLNASSTATKIDLAQARRSRAQRARANADKRANDPSTAALVRRLIYRVLVMILLFASFPLAARLMPSFVSPHFLQLVDDGLAPTGVLIALPLLGLVVGFVLWLLTHAESQKLAAVRILTWLLVWVLALANIVVRPVIYVASIQLAESVSSQLANWQPVILDNGTFDEYQQSCQDPTTTRYGGIPLVFKFAGSPAAMRVAINVNSIPHIGGFYGEWQASDGQRYVYVDRSIPASAYQCSIQDGLLSTRLSLPYDDLMVIYPGDDGKSVGLGAYYIETEIRPADGSQLSSCVLATAKFNVRGGESPGPTTVFSVVNTIDNGMATYQAKIYHVNLESGLYGGNKVNNIVQSDYLPFVLHDTLLDNFNGWVKLAVYKSNNVINLLVNDRIVATFTDPGNAAVYPQLGTRAGTASTGGTASCEFRYLRAYARS